MNYEKFGKNIRQKRLVTGLTLEQLSEKADMGANFLGKVERGQGKPSLETAVKIAWALECGLDALLCDQLPAASQYMERDVISVTSGMDYHTKLKYLEFMELVGRFFVDMVENRREER